MTVAFVMSGAANFGSLQVGALQVLLERGIRPDMLVGTSAGAMNAAYLALDPTLDGGRQLADFWRQAASHVVSRRDTLSMVWRLIARRDGLISNVHLRRFIERSLPRGIERFGDLSLPAYAVAVRLDNGQLRCFGDEPGDRILDGLMASTAIPGFFPPWQVDGAAYVDGGVMSYLPVQAAIERGATEVYALNVGSPAISTRALRGTPAIAGRAIDLLIQRQGARELEVFAARPDVAIHNLTLTLRREVAFWDFKHADELIDAGRRLTQAYLSGSPPRTPRRRTWRDRLSGWRSAGWKTRPHVRVQPGQRVSLRRPSS